jgi:AraC-like DNA-binding protein
MKGKQTQFALSLLAYAVQRDVSPVQLANASNVDLKALRNNEKYVITQKQLDDLWFHAAQLADDPLFGLHFGESLQLSALGIVGEIVKSSRTVGEAVRMAASLTSLVTDLYRMEVKQSSKIFSVELVPNKLNNGFIGRQMADLLMVFIVHELDGLLLEKIKPVAVQFPYVVSNPDEYARVLRCPISKSKKALAIQFPDKYWEELILTGNYELQTFLLQKVQAYKSKEKSKVFTRKIQQYMIAHAYLGLPSLDDVAANFNMTTRSLQRRLQDEGVSFLQMSNEVRKSLALHYLQSGSHPIKEISHMLGYNEVSAFSRAFKRWTGKAPANYIFRQTSG